MHYYVYIKDFLPCTYYVLGDMYLHAHYMQVYLYPLYTICYKVVQITIVAIYILLLIFVAMKSKLKPTAGVLMGIPSKRQQ